MPFIKEAILLAGEAQGNKIAAANKEPREGLVSYLKHLAANHPQSYAMLLGKVLPMQIERLSTTTAEYKTVEELQQALRARPAGGAHLPAAELQAEGTRMNGRHTITREAAFTLRGDGALP
jgi:hypothetical protein